MISFYVIFRCRLPVFWEASAFQRRGPARPSPPEKQKDLKAPFRQLRCRNQPKNDEKWPEMPRSAAFFEAHCAGEQGLALLKLLGAPEVGSSQLAPRGREVDQVAALIKDGDYLNDRFAFHFAFKSH